VSEQTSSGPDREELRRQSLAHAGAAFDLMFHPAHQADLITFDQREGRVCELMRDLGGWLLQRQAQADPAARPPEGQPVCCPKCGRHAKRAQDPGEDLPSRSLTTLTGEVELGREQWTCTACRAVFSPPGRQAGPGDRGLQPRRAAQGRPPGPEGALLSGGLR
jgi:hypothetical protein